MCEQRTGGDGVGGGAAFVQAPDRDDGHLVGLPRNQAGQEGLGLSPVHGHTHGVPLQRVGAVESQSVTLY